MNATEMISSRTRMTMAVPGRMAELQAGRET
jgi:hypothetical protein